MQNIYLVGFMGTGKNAVALELARCLKLKLIDIDDLIVQREKCSINEIFSQKGEPYFRLAEKEVLQEVSLNKGQVVASGGGIVIDPDNITVMKKTGKIILLSARPEVIFERVKKDTHRPLLNVSDPLAKINELLLKRAPYYAKADFSVDTSDLSVKQILDNILAFLNK